MRQLVYHEKQVKSLCALHALNNLFQDGKAYKQEDLEKISNNLAPNSWLNPHKSLLGLGNYDINVIMSALQLKKYEAVWFDKRKDPSELNFDQIFGFILNIPVERGWLSRLPIKRKHWVAIRNIPAPTEIDAGRSQYFNLDSKFESPEAIGTETKLIEYFREELKSSEKELFIVVSEQVGKSESWKKNQKGNKGTSTSIRNKTLRADILEDKEERKGSTDSGIVDRGVVELLSDLRDINVVDLDKEDLMRRQSSGVWSDYM